MDLGLGIVGAWYTMVTVIVFRATLLAWRFYHGGWQRIVL